MPSLSAAHHAALTAIVEACPDASLGMLGAAVAALKGDKAAELANIVAAEARDRARRGTAFAPLLPLFQPRADGVPALAFPPRVLKRVWREAVQGEEDFLPLLDGAVAVDGEWTLAADRLCAKAAAVLRDRPRDVWPEFQRPADDQPPSTPVELAGCFDLTPLARSALPRLPVWLERPDDNQLAGLRLLIQDCMTMSPDGGRRMIDILFAHVADAERMLRVVTRTSRLADREITLSHSEMGVFVERLLTSVQARVQKIAAVVRSSLGETAMRAADGANCVTIQLEMKFIDVGRLGDWLTVHPGVVKRTGSLVFMRGEIREGPRLVATAVSTSTAVAIASASGNAQVARLGLGPHYGGVPPPTTPTP